MDTDDEDEDETSDRRLWRLYRVIRSVCWGLTRDGRDVGPGVTPGVGTETDEDCGTILGAVGGRGGWMATNPSALCELEEGEDSRQARTRWPVSAP